MSFQRILILGRHTLTLMTMRIHPTHMAPFSVNITHTEYGRFRSGVELDH